MVCFPVVVFFLKNYSKEGEHEFFWCIASYLCLGKGKKVLLNTGLHVCCTTFDLLKCSISQFLHY